MNPITRFFKSVTAVAMRWSGLSYWGGTGAWDTFLQGATRHNWRVEAGDGSTNAAVVACIKAIQRAFPEAPMIVSTRATNGELKPELDHPLLQRLEQPNPHYSGHHLWAATVADFALHGNAYWIKVRAGGGRVVELWWVPAPTMEPRWATDGTSFIDYYDYMLVSNTTSGTIKLDPADVVHFRDGFDPDNVRKGLSPIRALFREIATDNEAANWSASMLRNMGVPGVVIAPDGDASPSEADLEDVKTKFVQRFSGDNRGMPLVMRGPTKVTTLSFSPQQMKLTDLRRVPEERISAAIGVPAIVAGLGVGLDHATYSNVAQAREAFYEQCLIPMQRLLAAEVQGQLVPDFGDPAKLRVSFDLKQVRVLQADQNELHARVREDWLGGLLTLNQSLVMLGEKPLPGPEGDVRIIPNTHTTVRIQDVAAGLAAASQQAALPPGTPGEEPPGDQQPPPGEETNGGKALTLLVRKAATQDDLLARFDDSLALLTADLADELMGAWEEMADAAAGRLAAALKDGVGPGAVEAKADGAPPLVSLADHDPIARLLRSYVLKAMRQAAEDLAPLTGGTAVRITRNMPAVKAAIADMEERLPGIAETTDADMGRLLAKLERRPGSVPLADVQAALREHVAETYPGRSELIAQTELGAGHAKGVLLVAEKSGIASRVHVHDGDQSDAVCTGRNGSVVTLEEARGIGLAHPRCQLRLLPVIEAA